MHSEYIRILCELGIVGLVLFFSLLFSYIIRIVRIWIVASDYQTKKYALTSLLCLLSYMIVCITGNAIGYIFSFSLYIFAFVSFSFQCYDEKVAKYDSP